MRKIVLFAVTALIVIATGAWVGVRTLAPASAVAEQSSKLKCFHRTNACVGATIAKHAFQCSQSQID